MSKTRTDQMEAALRELIGALDDGMFVNPARFSDAVSNARVLLSAEPPEDKGEFISVTDINEQIDHVKENGIALAKFGGQDADEGRCRELCAMYLREFVINHAMKLRLDSFRSSDAGADNALQERLDSAERAREEPFGCALAMRVLQSDLYLQLDDTERAECDELVSRWNQHLRALQPDTTRKDE